MVKTSYEMVKREAELYCSDNTCELFIVAKVQETARLLTDKQLITIGSASYIQ